MTRANPKPTLPFLPATRVRPSSFIVGPLCMHRYACTAMDLPTRTRYCGLGDDSTLQDLGAFGVFG